MPVLAGRHPFQEGDDQLCAVCLQGRSHQVHRRPSLLLEFAAEVELALRDIGVLKARPQWEVRAERKLTRELTSAMQSATDGLADRLQALGQVPGDEAQRARLLAVIERQLGEVSDRVTETARVAAQHGHNRTVSQLQRAGRSVTHTSLTGQALDRVDDSARVASERMVGRVKSSVSDLLASRSGVGGEGLSGLTEELKQAVTREARAAARAEVQNGQQVGGRIAEDEHGVDYHRWTTAADDVVRDSHVDLHGEVTRVGVPFSNGLLHPLDEGGPIEEWINCRCWAEPWTPPDGTMAPPGADRFFEDDVVPAPALSSDA